MKRLFTICGCLYIAIYAFEGVVRWGLNAVGANSAIFVRDALFALPVTALLVAQAFRLRVHPAFLVFFAVVAVHGAMMYLNMHTSEAVVYGVKILMPILFGFLAASTLVQPERRTLLFFVLILIASQVGLFLDKFLVTFPWIGMTTHIGGLTVDISHDWETGTSGLTKRAAGFTRWSIAAAGLIPILTLMIAPRIRNWFLRVVVLAAALAGVFFTTQKGALLSLIPVSLILCGPRNWRYPLLAVVCTAFFVLGVALPITTGGMLLTDSGGVFSTASFAMRIIDTWPDAWQWIDMHQVFPLGVGLGGIGGAQRVYALDYTNPADNVFLLYYAWFGVLGLLYLAWPIVTAWRVPRTMWPRAEAALAILTFLIGYGAVVTVIEDPLSALFVGASSGMMWALRQQAFGRAWVDPFVREQPSASLQPTPGAIMVPRRSL